MRKHSSRMRTDRAVTRSSSEPVSMRPIVDRQAPVKTLPSLAVGNEGYFNSNKKYSVTNITISVTDKDRWGMVYGIKNNVPEAPAEGTLFSINHDPEVSLSILQTFPLT